MPLMSGERQVATSLSGIRGDHVARYRFVSERVKGWDAQYVLDAGCGVGYGSRMLAEVGASVYAWDHDNEAIDYARQHYEDALIRWSVSDICAATCRMAQLVVAFEVLEHLARPGLALIRFPDRLIASVPNANAVPMTPGKYPFHVRHYTPPDFELLLAGAGYRVTEWWSQRDTGASPLVRGSNGRTIVAICER